MVFTLNISFVVVLVLVFTTTKKVLLSVVQNVFMTVQVLLSSLLNLKNSTGTKSLKVLPGSTLLVLLQLSDQTWFRLVSKAAK